MSYLKIPFGLQGDTIVMIEDISPEARGRKCNCVCPSCKAPLLARLGEIRTHHFAHSGEGCDEQIAFLSGLYQMVQEYILNNEIVLPKLEVFWGYKRTKFTLENFFDRIRFSPAPGFEEKILIAQESRIKFEKSEVVCTGKTPTALILEVKSRQMAICIRPPANICKVFSVKPYKNMATLEMNGSGIPFGELKKEQIIKALRKELENSRWNYNLKALKAIDDINKANDVWLEIIRKKEEKEQQSEEQRQLQWQQRFHASVQSFGQAVQLPSLTEEEKRQVGYVEVKDQFTQQETQIRDSYGQRWIRCDICGEIKPSSECSSYGGKRINSGICRECSRKGLG